MLLVLEDGHWADAPTLLLLRHLARSAWSARLLLLATFRDTEADLPGELSETLADLRRSDDVVRMRLSGLSGAEVSDLVSRAAGSDPEPELRELASTIHDLTGGNAFLVCELWRALVETGMVEVAGGQVRVTRPLTELGTPESVREVVSQRLSRLAPRTTDLLELAAVGRAGVRAGADPPRRRPRRARASRRPRGGGGKRDDRGAPLAAAGLPLHPRDRAAGALRPALAAAAGGAPPPRRGGARERRRGLRPRARGPRPSLRRRRPVRRGRAGDRLQPARGAARRAPRSPSTMPRRGCAPRSRSGSRTSPSAPSALLELGSASHRAGKATDALEAFASAAEIARGLGSAELLARAAIGYEEACWRPGVASRDAVELLEEALAAVGDESDELRIGLLAGLARALDFQGERERGAIVRENAVALARRHEDRAGLAKVLVRSYWARGTTPLEEILPMLTEARDLAEELGDAETHTEAMAWRVPTFVALGDLESARAEVAALREMAERTAQPFMNHVAEHYGSAIALCDGNLAGAEAMAERSHEWGRLLTGRDASGIYGIQMFGVRREQGRLAELAPAVRILAGEADREGPWRPGLVAVLAELGMEREARRELSRLAAEGIDGFRASLWLATLAYLTDACAALGDEAMAAIVYPELEPLAGTNVMIGHLVACYGAADRYLGMLAATLGEPERAEEHFERAMEQNRRMGASTWVAHTAYEYGRFLLGRGRGARERAGGAARRGRRPGRADRHGGTARQDPRARRRPLPAPACPAGSPRARRRSWSWSPRGSATARSARSSRSASTPRPTTSAASCARPTARTAPRRRPTPTGTGSPRRRAEIPATISRWPCT